MLIVMDVGLFSKMINYFWNSETASGAEDENLYTL